MAKFKVCIQHEQTLTQTRMYEIEAANEDGAREKAVNAWDAYNSGRTDGVLRIDGEEFTPPDAEEVMDGCAHAWVVDAEDELADDLPRLETPHVKS